VLPLSKLYKYWLTLEVGFSDHAEYVTKKLKVVNLLLYVEKDTVVMIQLSSMDTLPNSSLF
jgi:hypothetical protein